MENTNIYQRRGSYLLVLASNNSQESINKEKKYLKEREIHLNSPRKIIKRMATLCLITFMSMMFSGCLTWELGSAGQRRMEGKNFVILGASSGFGRGVAEQLGEYGANVVVAARRTDLLEEVAANVRAGGGTALVVTMDVTNPEDVQRLADAALEEYGHIDVWINMAGVGGIGRMWDIPHEDHAQIIDVGLTGLIHASQVAVRIFRDQGHGRLLNMGSVESFNPLAYHAAYAASQAGLLNMGQALNHELRLHGMKQIRVLTIEPWATDTPFWRHAANYSGGTPRMAAMDPARKVVNATIRASLRRRNEVPVGWKARATWVSHRLFPRFTERISANIIHKYQIENAPPAPPTSGTLHEPMEEGRGVENGVRERIQREKRERRRREN